MRQLPDTLLADRFRLRTPLAHGGMGELWLAEHVGLGTEVVAKFISTELAGSQGAAERFAREAAAAARVNSPHVVKILDYGLSVDGAPFIVMEKLEGRDLAAQLAASGPLSPDAVARIVRQLAKALARTHALGIVHRDIKPANVFVCAAENELFVKLLDFGIAKRAVPEEDAATGSGICVGTPGYMSPEQLLASRNVDRRADLWSLGVLAFQCLTGRKPFEGETAGAIALAIHTLALPKLSRIVPSLPTAVDEWFERACALEPAQRFESATEMSNAFSRALAVPLDALVADVESAPEGQGPEAGSTLLLEAPREGDSLVHSTTTRPTMARRRQSRMALVVAVAAAGVIGFALRESLAHQPLPPASGLVVEARAVQPLAPSSVPSPPPAARQPPSGLFAPVGTSLVGSPSPAPETNRAPPPAKPRGRSKAVSIVSAPLQPTSAPEPTPPAASASPSAGSSLLFSMPDARR